MKRLDLRGFSNRRLTVIGESPVVKNSKCMWQCRCECGSVLLVPASGLKSGRISSCGCLISEKKNHKDNRYRVWCGMIQRCKNKNAPKYPKYGGVGVTICERWSLFENFIEDMGPRPKGTTLDRKDSKGNYCKDNCRWATHVEQNRNRSWNHCLTMYGKTLPVVAWSEISGISASTIISRLHAGWSDRLAVFTPPRKSGKKATECQKVEAV
jgi:hypothetical protein